MGTKIELSLQELAKYILDTAERSGLSFPADVTKLNVALLSSGLNYSDLGYEKCKDMFVALGDYFELSHPYPSALFVDVKGSVLAKTDEVRQNLLPRYFELGLMDKQKYLREFQATVYMKDREMSAVVLNKLTQRNEITVEGWCLLVAFAYHLAVENVAVHFSRDGRYLCFDLDLLTVKGERIYALAAKTGRSGTDWMLKGIVTKSSYNLGGLLKEKFGDIL